MERLLWICVAGALGTGVRYLTGLWVDQKWGSAFPYATLIVNVSGCFLIAVVAEIALRKLQFPPTLRLALTTGFMGGLTTYSSFAYETLRLLRDGSPMGALANWAATTVLCFVAVAAGMSVAGLLVRP